MIIISAVLGLVLLSSCVKGFDGSEQAPTPDPTPTNNQATQEEIAANVVKVFGTTFSPDQDWSSTTKYSVSVTADAPMADIAKVQILTEAPYFNDDARVLNEATTSKGQTVTLTYDCPAEYTELVAACVDSKGVYYIAGFKAGDAQVTFQTAAKARTRAAYDLPTLPDPAGLKMKYKNSYLTYNAMRAQKAGQEGEDTIINPWKNSNWDNERIWMLSNEGGNGTWKVEKSAIYRDVTITDAEKQGLETILTALGGKKGRDGTFKQMNLNTIRTSPVYELTKNYLVADGKAPITVAPVQMLSTEINNSSVYYYYFNPNELNGKSEEEQIAFIKNLPKFKCIDSKLTKTASGIGLGVGDYFKVHEYVLPYFGDIKSDETNDVTVQSFVIPEGYYVGFMFRKNNGKDWADSFSTDNDAISPSKGTGYKNKS